MGYLRISDSAIEHRANKKKKKKKGENRDDRRRGGISSVQSLSHVRLFATAWTAARQVSLSITNSESLLKLMPLSQWCHPTISSTVVPFSSCLQSFPALGSFPRSQFFASGSQNIGVSASASVLPMNIQDWFPLGLTDLYFILIYFMHSVNRMCPKIVAFLF